MSDYARSALLLATPFRRRNRTNLHLPNGKKILNGGRRSANKMKNNAILSKDIAFHKQNSHGNDRRLVPNVHTKTHSVGNSQQDQNQMNMMSQLTMSQFSSSYDSSHCAPNAKNTTSCKSSQNQQSFQNDLNATSQSQSSYRQGKNHHKSSSCAISRTSEGNQMNDDNGSTFRMSQPLLSQPLLSQNSYMDETNSKQTTKIEEQRKPDFRTPCRSNSRKRSWMAACMDVLSTPYRKIKPNKPQQRKEEDQRVAIKLFESNTVVNDEFDAEIKVEEESDGKDVAEPKFSNSQKYTNDKSCIDEMLNEVKKQKSDVEKIEKSIAIMMSEMNAQKLIIEKSKTDLERTLTVLKEEEEKAKSVQRELKEQAQYIISVIDEANKSSKENESMLKVQVQDSIDAHKAAVKVLRTAATEEKHKIDEINNKHMKESEEMHCMLKTELSTLSSDLQESLKSAASHLPGSMRISFLSQIKESVAAMVEGAKLEVKQSLAEYAKSVIRDKTEAAPRSISPMALDITNTCYTEGKSDKKKQAEEGSKSSAQDDTSALTNIENNQKSSEKRDFTRDEEQVENLKSVLRKKENKENVDSKCDIKEPLVQGTMSRDLHKSRVKLPRRSKRIKASQLTTHKSIYTEPSQSRNTKIQGSIRNPSPEDANEVYCSKLNSDPKRAQKPTEKVNASTKENASTGVSQANPILSRRRKRKSRQQRSPLQEIVTQANSKGGIYGSFGKPAYTTPKGVHKLNGAFKSLETNPPALARDYFLPPQLPDLDDPRPVQNLKPKISSYGQDPFAFF